jgi:peptide/nickel transport system permease protein
MWIVGIVAIFIAGSFGTLVGILAGYFERWAPLLMRFADIVQGLPLVLMAIVTVALVGPSLLNILLIIAFFLWPYYARQIRVEVLTVKKMPFVELARTAGVPANTIVLRHIIPNVAPTLFVLASLQLSVVVLLEASLSFLGVGVPPPTPAWGLMISDGRAAIGTAWWIAIWPGIALSLTVFAVTIVSDYIRDRTDPKTR